MTVHFPRLAGQGKGAHTPTEAADSLFSNNIAHILDILSEGEIEGIVGGKKGIFYNEVPLLSENGTENFKGVIVAGNNGTPDQPSIPGFEDTSTSVGVGQDLPYNVYKTISFPNGGDITAATVTIAATNFFEVTKDGDTVGTTCSFVIERSQNGGAFEPIYNGQITGKQPDEYTVDYRIPITDPTGNTALRVKRTKPDTTSLKINDAIKFKTYTKVVEHRFSYPNLASYGHIIDAKQFGNQLPSRQYHARGILCRIPHNYDPVTRAYNGPFNGTMTAKKGGKRWTNNPVYIFYEIVTNKRYGLGKFFDEALLDIPSLYMAAKWCDELVSDGRGGMEPRWTCNTVINTRGEAYNLLKELVSAFRGSLFWMQAKLWAVGDQPREPVKLVTNANVIHGKFIYTGESNRKRYSVYNITWNDPALLFRRTIETVEDPQLIREFGYKPTDYGAFACSSASQARRVGLALLYAQENEDQIISYKASFDHMAVDGDGPDGIAPGDLVLIADKAKGNAVAGGRIKAAGGSAVTLDRDPGNGSGTIWVEHKDGTIEWLTCTYAGAAVTLTEQPTKAVDAGDTFILIAQGYSPEPFVVLKITQEDKHILGITAVKYDEGRYAAIYGEQNIDPKKYMSLPSIETVQPVANVTFAETYVTGIDFYGRVLDVSWPTPTDPLYSYVAVSYSKDNDNWTPLPNASGNTARIMDARDGVYRVQVAVINRAGLSSKPVYAQHTVGVVPDTAVLATGTITNLVLQSSGNTFGGRDPKFAWTVNTPQSDFMQQAGVSPTTDVAGLADPLFRDCVVTVRRTTGEVLRIESVVGTSYAYTFERNFEDTNGAPVRSFSIGVQYRDKFGSVSPSVQIGVNNPAPAFETTPTASAGLETVHVSLTSVPKDLDYVGVRVYVSGTGEPALTPDNLKYTGSETDFFIKSLGPVLHRMKVVPYDAFGDGTPSSVIAASPYNVSAIITDIQSNISDLVNTYGATAAASQSAIASAASANVAGQHEANAATASTASQAARDAAQIAQGLATTQAGLADTARVSAQAANTAAQSAQALATTQAGLADTARANAQAAYTAAQSAQALATTQAGLADTARTNAQAANSAAQSALASATTQAGLADTARSQAQAANTAALGARDAAQAAQSAAQGSATTSAQYANYANTYQQSANAASAAASQSSGIATQAKLDAQTFANSASGFASQASSSATVAGQAATSASAYRDAAQTARGGAESARDSAAASSTNAAGSASSASQSAGVSASARDASYSALSAQFPPSLDPVSGITWIKEGPGSLQGPATDWPGGAYAWRTDANVTNQIAVVSVSSVPCIVGERYRVTAWAWTSGSNTYAYAYAGGNNAQNNWYDGTAQGIPGVDYATPSGALANGSLLPPTTWTKISTEYTINSTSPAFHRPISLVRSNNASLLNGVAYISAPLFERITSEAASKGFAAASATSASNAAASNTAAGQQASAAQQSATNASTFAGQAGTYASQASTSASNAAGSATSASTQAGIATSAATNAQTYRDQGAGYASAAAGSASTASSKATDAGQSATAASASATSAQTSAGQANTYATQASSSATNALGSANSASTSAGVAVGARDAAKLSENAAATSASSAATSNTQAGQQASAAQQSATTANTAAGNANTYASQASTSATNAAGAATTATTQAGVATSAATNAGTYRDQSLGYANSAAGSASTASSSATTAGQQASAASASATSANTSAGNAQTYANNASTSATNAAGSASSASTSAGVAVTAKNTAQVLADSLFPRELTPQTLASFRYEYDGYLIGPDSGWPASYLMTFDNGMTNPRSLKHAAMHPKVLGQRMRVTFYVWTASAHARVALGVGMTDNADGSGQVGLAANDGTIPVGCLVDSVSVPQQQFVKFGYEWTVSSATKAFIAPYAYVNPVETGTNNPSGIRTHITAFVYQDVTSEYASGQAASAAATSASNAAASNTAAGQQATASQQSATNANTYAGQASTYASQASQSASNAAGSASSASQQAGIAATSAYNAGVSEGNAYNSYVNAVGSASSAAGSASTASSKADAAGQSATAASASATSANTSAGSAQTYANSASSSASSAAGSANSASSSAGVSATAKDTTIRTASQTLPSSFGPAEQVFWVYDEGNYYADHNFDTSYYGPAEYPVFATKPNESNVVAARGTFIPTPNRRYRITIEIARIVDGTNGRVSLVHYGLVRGQANGTTEYSAGYTINGLTDLAAVTWTQLVFDWVADGNMWWARPRIHWNDSGSTVCSNAVYHIRKLLVTDITDVYNAGLSASAAATSASNASASNNAAGQQANAAYQQAANALTFAGQSQTYANNAATSASNASGSSNTATQQAGIATSAANSAQTYRDQGQGYANSAAGSASTASSKADQAGQSANAASASATSASTSAGQASTYANNASSSASNAAGSANSAVSSAGVAATAASAAQATADRLFPKEINPNTLSSFYYTSDGYLSGPDSSWPTPYLMTFDNGYYGGRTVQHKAMHTKIVGQRMRLTFWVWSASPYCRVAVGVNHTNNADGSGGTGLSASDYAIPTGCLGGNVTNFPAQTFVKIGLEWTITATTQAFIIPYVYVNMNETGTPSNGRTHIGGFIWEDITSEAASLASASAAATSASSAAASSTTAGQQASSAQQQATNAQTFAGQASGSAGQAATSASNAAGSANSASSSAALSASAKDVSASILALQFPPSLDPTATNAWNKEGTGIVDGPATNWPGGAFAWRTAANTNDQIAVISVAGAPCIVGERYRVTAWAWTNGTNAYAYAYGGGNNTQNNWYDGSAQGNPASDYATPPGAAGNGSLLSPNTWTKVSQEYTISGTNPAFHRPISLIKSNGGGKLNGVCYVSVPLFERITSEAASKGFANAAATSASSANAANTAAGNSASAANQSKLDAQAANGSAQTAASNANSSASNADASRASAATYASQTAGYRDSAQTVLDSQFPASLDPVARNSYQLGQGGSSSFIEGPANASYGWPTSYVQHWTSPGHNNYLFFKRFISGIPGRRYRATTWIWANSPDPARSTFNAWWQTSNFVDSDGGGATDGYGGQVLSSYTNYSTTHVVGDWVKVGSEFVWTAGMRPFFRPIFECFNSVDGSPVPGDVYMCPITITDVTSEHESGNQASNASANAAAASASASNAYTSQQQAASYRDDAANQVTAAYNQAYNSLQSASQASASAASAASSATQAAIVTSTSASVNRNSKFEAWPDANGSPVAWSNWDLRGGNISRDNSRQAGGYAALMTATSAQPLGLVSGIYLTTGWYVLSATVWLQSGTWQGAGLYVDSQDGINFSTWPDNSGVVGYGGQGIRSFSRLINVTANNGDIHIYAMTNWDGWGTMSAKTMQWMECSVRPASDAEVQAKKATQAITTLSASITDTRSTVATLQAQAATVEQRLLAGQPNLLRNGSFESGFVGWAHSTYTTIVATPLGAWGQGAYGNAYTGGETVMLETEKISIYGGNWYTASSDMMMYSNSASSYAFTDIVFYDNANNIIGNGRNTDYMPAQDFNWSAAKRLRYAVTAFAPGGSYFATVRMAVSANGGAISQFGLRRVKLELGQTMSAYTAEASAAYQAGVLADHTGKLSSYLSLTANAGGTAASVKLVATDQNGNTYSSIALEAQEITLSNSTGSVKKTALSIVNNEATFTGKLNVQTTGGTGLSIVGNLITLYDQYGRTVGNIGTMP